LLFFCVVWFQLPTAVLQLQKNASCQFIIQPNVAFPRTRTELEPYVYKLMNWTHTTTVLSHL